MRESGTIIRHKNDTYMHRGESALSELSQFGCYIERNAFD